MRLMSFALASLAMTAGAIGVSLLIAWLLAAIIVSTPLLVAGWLLGVAFEAIPARPLR